jgi:hypothetical protein
MKTRLLSSLIFILTIFGVATAQQIEACAENRNAPPVSAYYWPPDTEVKVYLVRDMFTEEQQQTLFAAMKDWTNASNAVGAGVRFKYAGEVSGLVSCDGCLTVTRREVFKYDRKHYAFFNPLKRDDQGLLISAWIDFDFSTTKPQALRGFMAHELGHGMGLWDCKTCKKKQTIMNAFPGINKDNGLIEPSVCDLEVVKQVYQLERRVAGNMSTAGN